MFDASVRDNKEISMKLSSTLCNSDLLIRQFTYSNAIKRLQQMTINDAVKDTRPISRPVIKRPFQQNLFLPGKISHLR